MPRLKTITHKQGLTRNFVTLFEQAGVCTTKTCIAKLTPSLKNNITQFYWTATQALLESSTRPCNTDV
jgi:hypothetical protein